MYAIPGQHDLPLHNLEDIRRSGFWTLVKEGTIQYLAPGEIADFEGFYSQGFSWGCSITEPQCGGKTKIALVHEYIHTPATAYPGAPAELAASKKKYGEMGWHLVVHGDNHKGFLLRHGDHEIFNCGTLMRRKSDEIDYKPQVGLVHGDGTVEAHFLDTSKDVIERVGYEESNKEIPGISEFIEELASLEDTSLDFVEAMKQYMEKESVDESVKSAILEAMEDVRSE
jgi:hypothetical protein